MREHSVAADRVGRGWGSGYKNARRVVAPLDTPMFELLRKVAVSRGCGLATIAREYIEDGLAREKPAPVVQGECDVVG